MTRRRMYAKFIAVLLSFCLTSSWLPQIVSQAVGLESSGEVIEEPEGVTETDAEADETEEAPVTKEDTTEEAEETSETEEAFETETEEESAEEGTTEEVGTGAETEDGTESASDGETRDESETETVGETETESERETETETETEIEAGTGSETNPQESEAQEALTMNLLSDGLQVKIDAANPNDTIRLEEGITYQEDITLSHQLTIVGEKGSVIDGNVTCDAPVVFKGPDGANIEIEQYPKITGQLKCSSSLELSRFAVSGGVEVADGAGVTAKIYNNGLSYNNDVPAITITGTEGTSKGTYCIGKTKNQKGYSDDNGKFSNTFYNDGSGDAVAIVWPFTNRLFANENYWKLDDRDAELKEVLVDGNVQYANEYVMQFKGTVSRYAPIIPPDGFDFIKSESNTNVGYIEEGDSALQLFGRHFADLPLFTECEIKKVDTIVPGKGTLPAEEPYVFSHLYLSVYRDSDFGMPYSKDEFCTMQWTDGMELYIRLINPMMPIDIMPQNMVSYGGTSNLLSDDFPKVLYSLRTPNIFYNLDNGNNSERYIYFSDQIRQRYGNEEVSYLRAYMESKSSGGNRFYYGAEGPSDLEIDPDGDWLPFNAEFPQLEGPSVNSNQAAVHTIEVGNADDIPWIGYIWYLDPLINTSEAWVPLEVPLRFSPVYFRRNPSEDSKYDFTTNFQTADLTVRATSDKLMVKPIATVLPEASDIPAVAIGSGEVYKDSTGQTLGSTLVSMLEDSEEPGKDAYRAMLDKARLEPASKDKSYQYHFLSLLNTSDGNNVVTTPAQKTVYLPYPKDYKENGSLCLLYFDGYQRMPSDRISTMSVIQGQDLHKKEKGFTFITDSDLGAYLIAYDSDGTLPPETTAPPETTSPSEITSPPETTGGGNGGSGGNDHDRPTPTRPTTEPTNPAVPTGPVNPQNPSDPAAPTEPVIFPEEPDMPDTPNFINPPGGGGSVVKGEDGLYYHISADNVPLAYYDQIADSWVPLGSYSQEISPLPKTGEYGNSFWLTLFVISGMITLFITMRRRKIN